MSSTSTIGSRSARLSSCRGKSETRPSRNCPALLRMQCRRARTYDGKMQPSVSLRRLDPTLIAACGKIKQARKCHQPNTQTQHGKLLCGYKPKEFSKVPFVIS